MQRFRLLMHAAWLPNVPPADPLFPEALELIGAIETFLEGPIATGTTTRQHELARDITAFVANSSGIGMLATTIESIVELLDLEYERINPCFPEPPVGDESREALVVGFAALRKGINAYFQVDSPDDTLFPDGSEWKPVGPGTTAGLVKRAMNVREVADRAAMNAYRGIGHEVPEIFQQIDQLTEDLAEQRNQQGNLDRACDRTRSAYETLLRNRINLDGQELLPTELFKTSNLSVVWAHASAKPEFMGITLKPDIEAKLSPKAVSDLLGLRNELNARRNEYRKQTTELLKVAQAADATEGRLSKRIEELPDAGWEVHLRFASGGLADARVRLADLLNDLRQQESSGEGDKLFAPERPGTSAGGGSGGSADDLKVDGEPAEKGESKGPRNKLSHNHGDLVVDADVCSEELPHIGTDEDPDTAPDIVIFDATDPSITTDVFS
jgi:hypothetical protein